MKNAQKKPCFAEEETKSNKVLEAASAGSITIIEKKLYFEAKTMKKQITEPLHMI